MFISGKKNFISYRTNSYVCLSGAFSMMIVAAFLSSRAATPKDGGTSSTLLDKWNRSYNFDEALRSDSTGEYADPQ
jgi:hypothetical protein